MSHPSHTLIIRFSALGDVAMLVPVLRVFTDTYPETKLTVVSRKRFEPLFLDLPNVDFLEADVYGKHRGLFGLLKLAREAKELGIDTVADMHSVIRSKTLSKNLSFRGVKIASIDKGRSEKKNLTNAKGMGLLKLKTTHQRYAEVFKKLRMPVDLAKHRFPERKPLNPRLLTLIGKEPKKCIGIAPFAAYESKMYPLPLMQEVIENLDKEEHYRILLFGGGAEEIAQLKEWETLYSNVTNIAGSLTFEEELNLISNIDVMLSMDSANGHLAAIYGIPVITLWGVTHPYAGFTPFGQPEENQLLANRNLYPLIPTSVYGNKYPPNYEDCMKSIAPKTVVQKLLEKL
ncbi:MAG: glycosyltransferase family 9 protein [Flavobacteriaceae bacterium]|nr:glycosyltransferase family 9 protein [Flavobacteriaceae bacterium]